MSNVHSAFSFPKQLCVIWSYQQIIDSIQWQLQNFPQHVCNRCKAQHHFGHIQNFWRILDCFVPASCCLLQSIQAFFATCKPFKMILINKTIWLLHVNFFFKATIQEHSCNIHLMDLQIELVGNNKYCTNWIVFCHRCKYSIVGNTRFLWVSLCN